MNRNSIVKSRFLSICLRVLLYVFALLLIVEIFYLYHDGGWKELIYYYRYFLNPKKLGEFIASFGPLAGLIFVVVQVIQVVAAPIPGEMTGFVGGFLFGKVWGVILSTVGLTLGSMFAFWVARKFGIRLVERVVKKQYLDKFNFFVTHKGLYITFVMFLLPGFPKDALCYFLGVTRLRFLDFILMNLFGRFPGTMILTMQGSAVRTEHWWELFWLLIITVVMIVTLYFSRNYVIELVRKITRSFIRSVIRRKKKKRSKAKSVIGKDVE
ncbi:MAG: TVP38/TMEM64 family protein [Syntrophorhabdus sp.]|nr:TVP38/TMEM64 family protein [Syntrophorhabdus sp.]